MTSRELWRLNSLNREFTVSENKSRSTLKVDLLAFFVFPVTVVVAYHANQGGRRLVRRLPLLFAGRRLRRLR